MSHFVFPIRRRLIHWSCALSLGLLCSSGLSYAQVAPSTDLVAKGQALAIAADCAACHTHDPSHPYAGGLAMHSPMGVIYSSNITPSTRAGIGGYSEQAFADALRRGVAADGKHLYPAMPYTAYAGLSNDDVHALYTYFMHGVRADDQSAPATQLSFPFNLRILMAGWNLLYRPSAHPDQAPASDGSVARGKYLVDTLGHCSSCHSPRGLMMAEDQQQYLAGGRVEGWIAPNITSDAISGIGSWSQQQLVDYLKNGHVAGKGQAAGSMAEAISKSFRFLPDSDLQAIAAYLKTVPAIRQPTDQQAADSFSGDGKLPSLSQREPLRPTQHAQASDPRRIADSMDAAALYTSACASCHQDHGNGTRDQYFPSLSHNRAVGLASADNLVQVILHGLDRQGADSSVSMPAFDKDLNDSQVAAIANYVEQHFGNPAVHTDAAAVAKLRQGEDAPWLLKFGPWLLALMGLGIIVIGGLLMRRRSH